MIVFIDANAAAPYRSIERELDTRYQKIVKLRAERAKLLGAAVADEIGHPLAAGQVAAGELLPELVADVGDVHPRDDGGLLGPAAAIAIRGSSDSDINDRLVRLAADTVDSDLQAFLAHAAVANDDDELERAFIALDDVLRKRL